MKSEVGVGLRAFLKYGSVSAGVSAIVTDVLTPLAQLGLWVCGVSLLLAVAIIFIGRARPNLFSGGDSVVSALWYLPLSFCFMLMALTTLVVYQYNSVIESKSGALANNSLLVKEMQEALGISADIRGELTKLSDSNKRISENSANVMNAVEVISQSMHNNTFSEYDFMQAIKNGDVERVSEYLESKKMFDSYLYPMALGEKFVVFELIRFNRTEKIVPMLEFLHEQKIFDLNTLYSHPHPTGGAAKIFSMLIDKPMEDEYGIEQKKYEAREEEIKEYMASLEIEAAEHAKKQCKRIDEETELAMVAHEKSKIEWQKRWDDAVRIENERKLAEYNRELDEWEAKKARNKKEIDDLHAGKQDYKSSDDWLERFQELENERIGLVFSPYKPAPASVPSNFEELYKSAPPLVSPTKHCIEFNIANDYQRTNMELAPKPLDRPEIKSVSLGRSYIKLTKYAEVIGNALAMDYLNRIDSSNAATVAVKMYDYNDNLIYEGP